MTTALEIFQCPLCGATVGDSFLATNALLSPRDNAIINEYHPTKEPHRCHACSETLLRKYKTAYEGEKHTLIEAVRRNISAMPIVSIHHPHEWTYDTLGIVTAQATTGTGVFAELTTAFHDLFGNSEHPHHQKIQVGEDMCKTILRKRALDLGGNAILGVDVSYTEVGNGRGMLMVCMTGTAVSIRQTDTLGAQATQRLFDLFRASRRLRHLLEL